MRNFAVVTLVIFLATSCGISTSTDEAFEIESDRIVVDGNPEDEVQAPGPALDDDQTGRVYLVNETDQLVLIERQFREPPTPQIILDALVKQPLAEEIALNGFLKTELPTTLNPVHSMTDPENLTIGVTVADEAGLRLIAQSDAPRTQRIFAQIVCSLDWFEIGDQKLTGVLISDSAGPIVATDAETASIDGPASPADFRNCRN